MKCGLNAEELIELMKNEEEKSSLPIPVRYKQIIAKAIEENNKELYKQILSELKKKES